VGWLEYVVERSLLHGRRLLRLDAGGDLALDPARHMIFVRSGTTWIRLTDGDGPNRWRCLAMKRTTAWP
jgi:hypothetical protein